MDTFNWSLYFTIVLGGMIGAAAIIPYAFTVNREKLEQVPMPRRTLILVSVIQAVVMAAVFTFIGLLAADAVGLSITASAESLPLAIGLGIGATVLMIALDQLFWPYMPQELKHISSNVALWKRLIAGFYGGINEEIMMRLGLVSVVTWLLGHIWQTSSGTPADGAFWVAILFAALIFGVGHLPTVAGITRLTPLLVLRTLLLNGIGGLAFGWLFWQHGFLAAVVAHFTADMVLHVAAPMFIRRDHHDDTPLAQAA